MTRRHLTVYEQIPAGRYALLFIPGENGLMPSALWLGGQISDTRLYSPGGEESQEYNTKGWGDHVRLMLLTNDEATHLLTVAKLLDLRDEAWTDYVTDFVSTLTNEEDQL